MRTLLQLLCLCWLTSLAIYSTALTKEQQADSHLLSAQKAYKSGDYREAVSAFEAIEQLNVDMVEDFHFFYAMALNKSNRPEKSWQEVNLYLNKTGRGGSYYQKALDLHQSLSAKRKAIAKDHIQKVETEKQSWKKFLQNYKLRFSIRDWLSTQIEKSEQLLQKGDIDGAMSLSKEALAKSEQYKSKVKSRYNKLQPYQKQYYEVRQAHEMALLNANFYPMHKKQYTAVLNAYETLEFEAFDLYYQIASKRMKKDYSEVQTALNKAKTRHKNNTSLIKKKVQCESLKSRIDGYEGVYINYKNTLSSDKSNYAASCEG